MSAATNGMVEAREAIERALIGPTSGGAARQLAPVILAAIVNGQVPGVSFTPAKPETFGVIWTDLLLGPLSFPKPNAASAIEAAASMRKKGRGKIKDCHAVRLSENSDTLEYLDRGTP